MTAKVSQQTNLYDLLDPVKGHVFKGSKGKTTSLYLISVTACFLFFFSHVDAQETEAVSNIALSNFLVSEIVNSPETMNVEGYYLELTISQPENLNSLTFEIERYPEEGEADLQAYPMEILRKEDGIYLVIQHNHFRIENGSVRMHLNIDPEGLIDNTKYRLIGMDTQGLPLTPVEFSHFQ